MVIDIFDLAQLYAKGEVTDEHVLLHYGQEVLERLIRILTDPFDEVLGG